MTTDSLARLEADIIDYFQRPDAHRPCHGHFGGYQEGTMEVCGVTAARLQSAPDADFDSHIDWACNQYGLTYDEAWEFVTGWDQWAMELAPDRYEYSQAYELGRRLAQHYFRQESP
jgi:hypothetical protein